jgi:hypothetical protein
VRKLTALDKSSSGQTNASGEQTEGTNESQYSGNDDDNDTNTSNSNTANNTCADSRDADSGVTDLPCGSSGRETTPSFENGTAAQAAETLAVHVR